MSSGSQRIALGSFVEINIFFFRKAIKTYFIRPFHLYEITGEDVHRMSVMNSEAEIRKSPKTPAKSPKSLSLSFFSWAPTRPPLLLPSFPMWLLPSFEVAALEFRMTGAKRSRFLGDAVFAQLAGKR